MKKVLAISLLLLLLNACRAGDEIDSLQAVDSNNLSWAFFQFNVPEEGGKMETYYLYGRVAESMLARIADNRIEHGFVFLRDVRYWGNDDTIKAYRDGENTGDLVYRIEDVRRVKIVRNEPKVGMTYDDFTRLEQAAQTKAAAPAKKDNKL